VAPRLRPAARFVEGRTTREGDSVLAPFETLPIPNSPSLEGDGFRPNPAPISARARGAPKAKKKAGVRRARALERCESETVRKIRCRTYLEDEIGSREAPFDVIESSRSMKGGSWG
jgi:hypothetical protein